MIDESMNISIIDHFVMFATIIREGLSMTIFLNLSKMIYVVIYDDLINHLKN